jgi:hypothetical protein
VTVGDRLPRVLSGDERLEASAVVANCLTNRGAGSAFDLITCTGLHYVDDKLAVLTRAASWLTCRGLFIADLDLTSVWLDDRRPAVG